jgi:6-phospho-beta-glucosidase
MSSNRIRVAVLGGSALATPKLFEVMGRLGARRAYDFSLSGRDLQRLDLVCQVSRDISASFPNLDVAIRSAARLEDCVDGADFVINQVRVGGLEGRAYDETFPRQFGIPGEETVGPGGFTNSMRGIPVILEICRVLEKLAPGCVLLNLTNPSSIIQYAIRRYTAVQVIGTCDSPVSLMEMVAGVLQAPLSELDFDIGGMHHFGWITDVRHADRQRLPEVVQRAAEMPKLGVDPELIQALGVIPSFYAKYYFHPDRILAATEGRKIRAHELMELSDAILAAYHRWQPGQPADMVNQRGAVWYEKIVVPALLALAEGQTTQMVLSVDNQGAFPWLPDGAIVEARVPVQAGVPQAPLPAAMPQDIQALMAQNCAYEMLAAEAIAERDRSKALRALQANLLVKNFNTARGILQLVWSGEQKYTPKTHLPNNGKPIGDTLKVPTLHFGESLVEGFKLTESSYALVTMEEPWELVKGRLKKLPDIVFFVRDLDWYKLEVLERSLPEVEAVVALGGGTPTDAAKYLAWRRRLPVDIFPSITSVDAAVTKSIAARAGGHVTYIGYIVPRHVYVDYRLIQGAPPRLNISGVGDILCAHTALWDWRLARAAIQERYDSAAVAEMQTWLGRILAGADHIRQVSQEGIQLVMDAFAEISIICRRYGSSRPQEASDHTFAYNAEFQTGKSFLHGELVALGTYLMAELQDNNPEFLLDAYQRTGLLWQPADIGLTRDELIHTLRTLNWYQKNFGRRYSILNQKTINQAFIDRMLDRLAF